MNTSSGQRFPAEPGGRLPRQELPMSEQDPFQSYRSLLFSIAYRMLGSVMDAEDCVQEAFLQWHAAMASSEGPTIEHPKAFLCTLVTRRCIDHLRLARVQRETYVGLWLPEPLVEADPAERPELDESLSVTFLLLLERLSPIERAVFLLRQVFDYDYAEIAAFVGKSEKNCRQMLHRARQHLRGRRPPLSPMPKQRQQQVFTQFLQAWREGNMEGMLHVLSEEIVLHTDGGGQVHTARYPLYGPERVARYLLGLQRKYFSLVKVTSRTAPINGHPGLLCYLSGDTLLQEWLAAIEAKHRMGTDTRGMRETTKEQLERYQHASKNGQPVLAVAFTFAEQQIQEIDLVVNPEKLRHIPPLSFEEKSR